MPWLWADLTTARMTAFNPGASPPPVEYSNTPNRFHSEVSSGSAAHTDSGAVFKNFDLKYSIRSGSPPLADQTEMSVPLTGCGHCRSDATLPVLSRR